MLEYREDLENRFARLLKRVLMGLFLTECNDMRSWKRETVSRIDLHDC